MPSKNNNSNGGTAFLAQPYYSPKEASLALSKMGISICANTFRRRCGLSPENHEYVCRLHAFRGRYLIPRSELQRILLLEDSRA